MDLDPQGRRLSVTTKRLPAYAGAPWAVRMGVDLAELIAMGRIGSHERRMSFVAALTAAVGA